jgi:hypothetical protein
MSATYVCGLKLPFDLILENHEMVDSIEPSPMGSRTIKMARRIGPPFRLQGYNRGMLTPVVIPHYKKTFGVPVEIIDLWTKDHADADIVVGGLLLYARTESELDAMIKQRANVGCGLEPLMPQGDPRIASLNPKGMKVGIADEMPPIVTPV